MTPERYIRICHMLATRQPDLTVCLEKVHKPHNISAIIRTADAVGIHQIHVVWPQDPKIKIRAATSASSNNWVQITTHSCITFALEQLKQQGMQILTTHLAQKSVDFREIDYTIPTCILLGQEKYGITTEALAYADENITVPMIGMVQSLNVSVASAIIMYEAQRQRNVAGMYQDKNNQLSSEEQQHLLFEGGYPVLAKVARRKKLPYPKLDQQGNIIADSGWWKRMQATE